MAVTVSEKGWVVIPADLRKKYNLHPGAEVAVVDYGGVLKSLTRARLTEHGRERTRGR